MLPSALFYCLDTTIYFLSSNCRIECLICGLSYMTFAILRGFIIIYRFAVLRGFIIIYRFAVLRGFVVI